MSETSRVLLFPLNRWASTIRQTALEWIEQPTQADADDFKRGITEAIVTNLISLGATPAEIGREMGGFWHAVEIEAERVLNLNQSKG